MLPLMEKLFWLTIKNWYKNIWSHSKNFGKLRRWLHKRLFIKVYLLQSYYYKMIVIYLSKQQARGADPKAINQINFTGNLDWAGNKTMLFIIEETKETILDFSQGTVRVL